jgi:hypothetical protein
MPKTISHDYKEAEDMLKAIRLKRELFGLVAVLVTTFSAVILWQWIHEILGIHF